MGKLYTKNYHHTHLLLLLLVGIIHFEANAQVFPKDTIMVNGSRTNRINLVYLADGFMSSELPVFSSKATAINSALFNTVPFSQYKNYFNSFAVKVPSIASGAIHPGNASDEAYTGSTPTQPVANPTNYFQSTFDDYGIHRLLVPQNNVAINSVLASNFPDYDQAFVVVNSPYYGGSGGTYSTASTNVSSTEIAIHEIGHSLAGLADEYWAGLSYASEKPNMTANNNPNTIKWKSWLGNNNTGIYAHGSSGDPASWFKPYYACKMQALGNPFCDVCTERFIDKIHQLTNMIDDYAPYNTSISLLTPDSLPFSVKTVHTIPNNIVVNWYINDTLYVSGTSLLKIPHTAFRTGANILKAEVVDATVLSKSYLPGSGYINALTWNINKASILPISLKKFEGQIRERKGILKWQISQSTAPDHFELMKSVDGNKFSLLATIPVIQTIADYNYTDINLLSPYSYYKLKMIEKDGSLSYSSIVSLQNAFDNYSYKIYQNAEQHKYLLATTLGSAENISFSVADATGKIILKKDFGRVYDQLSYNFDLVNFPAGIYFLQLDINHSIYTSQLVAK